MNPKAKCPLQLEELERRDAPSALVVTPPNGPATPPASASLATQGCAAITAHATTASNGVVACS